MIDEKKITQAVDAYIGYPKELGEGVEVSMRRDAFREGAKWFKEALWHDASEKPQGTKVVLYQWHDEQGGMDVGIDGVFDDLEWKKFVEYNKITKWCYIHDILPKGGEK